MTGNYSDAAPPYGTPREKSLYEAWDRHEFCYPILEKMIGSIEGIVTIFDLGCGSGEVLKRLSQLGKGADLIGIDSSEVTIDYASQKLGESAYLIHRDINDVPDIRGKRFCSIQAGLHQTSSQRINGEKLS